MRNVTTMIKKDLILYGLILGLVVAGFYYIGVEYQEEKISQYNESKQVALNWAGVDSTQITCNEMKISLIKLSTETFDGKELIEDAMNLKYKEFGC